MEEILRRIDSLEKKIEDKDRIINELQNKVDSLSFDSSFRNKDNLESSGDAIILKNGTRYQTGLACFDSFETSSEFGLVLIAGQESNTQGISRKFKDSAQLSVITSKTAGAPSYISGIALGYQGECVVSSSNTIKQDKFEFIPNELVNSFITIQYQDLSTNVYKISSNTTKEIITYETIENPEKVTRYTAIGTMRNGIANSPWKQIYVSGGRGSDYGGIVFGHGREAEGRRANLFYDEASNQLKFRTNSGIIRTISMS